jgi:hypothetical protein
MNVFFIFIYFRTPGTVFYVIKCLQYQNFKVGDLRRRGDDPTEVSESWRWPPGRPTWACTNARLLLQEYVMISPSPWFFKFTFTAHVMYMYGIAEQSLEVVLAWLSQNQYSISALFLMQYVYQIKYPVCCIVCQWLLSSFRDQYVVWHTSTVSIQYTYMLYITHSTVHSSSTCCPVCRQWYAELCF